MAAPTAGLHFTPALLDGLTAGGCVVEGSISRWDPARSSRSRSTILPGTRCTRSATRSPPRWRALVERVREPGGRVWAVGTTVVRALESAAREDGTMRAGAGETRLMITPGYSFRVVDRMMTNFHLPRSTLLMLVSAFAGHELTMAAYRHAIDAAVSLLLLWRRDGDHLTWRFGDIFDAAGNAQEAATG